MMSLPHTLKVEIISVLDINFMGLLPNSFVNQYILAAVDYISKWVKMVTTKSNDNKLVIKFLKENIFFLQFGTPVAVISQNETHVCFHLRRL